MNSRISRFQVRALTGLIVACCALGQVAQGQVQTADRRPGNFDFYVLNLSWAPQFCASHSQGRRSSECDSSRHYGFIVHGLWPQNDDGTYPQACLVSSPLANSIVEQMMPVMPDRGLIQHEWSEHGICSGMAPRHYFDTVRKAHSTVKIPAAFQTASSQQSLRPADIEKQFAAANHAPADAFRVSCSRGQFVAIEVCLTKDLQYRACGSALRDCPAGQVNVPPIP